MGIKYGIVTKGRKFYVKEVEKYSIIFSSNPSDMKLFDVKEDALSYLSEVNHQCDFIKDSYEYFDLEIIEVKYVTVKYTNK